VSRRVAGKQKLENVKRGKRVCIPAQQVDASVSVRKEKTMVDMFVWTGPCSSKAGLPFKRGIPYLKLM
jgi:hypothetical protein